MHLVFPTANWLIQQLLPRMRGRVQDLHIRTHRNLTSVLQTPVNHDDTITIEQVETHWTHDRSSWQLQVRSLGSGGGVGCLVCSRARRGTTWGHTTYWSSSIAYDAVMSGCYNACISYRDLINEQMIPTESDGVAVLTWFYIWSINSTFIKTYIQETFRNGIDFLCSYTPIKCSFFFNWNVFL